jgi:hypothetical protein
VPVLTVTRDMILPTTVTGSYPRPLWFDRSLDGRSFKAGDSLFREPSRARAARLRQRTRQILQPPEARNSAESA